MAQDFSIAGVASLSETVENKLLEQIEEFVDEESRKSIFAIGGRIPIDNESKQTLQTSQILDPSATAAAAAADPQDSVETDVVEPAQILKSPPITIRWDTQPDPKSTTDNELTLRTDLPPVRPGDDGKLDRLINACSPATFGRGMKDVYDESYRKASKLDPSQFSTNFNPYEFGIVDSIAKVLLPSVLAGSGMKTACSRGVRAELYKLNVYSAPSGKFKAHVDTPRDVTQFGSLVVCLPSSHEGGQLVVRHREEEMVFDWASTANSTSTLQQLDTRNFLQWAAFYSDCEHEVLEVIKGHRITLTYNLYVVSRGIPSGVSAMDPGTLPIAKLFRDMLSNPGFLNKGAMLGFHCAHAYAHTNQNLLANQTLPSSLKGIDMALYVGLRAAGLEVCLRPSISATDWRESRYDDHGFEEWMVEILNLHDARWDNRAWGRISDWISDEGLILKDASAKIEIEVQNSNGNHERRLETDNDLGPKLRPKLLSLWQHYRNTTIIGKGLWPFQVTDRELGETDENVLDVLDEWAAYGTSKAEISSYNKSNAMFKDYFHLSPELEFNYGNLKAEKETYGSVRVYWLNHPVHEDPAIGYMTYGNQSSPAMLYSGLAIFAKVPPLNERLD